MSQPAPPSAATVWVCTICQWIYDSAQGDPGSGIVPGTPFEDLQDDWACPECGVGKDQFEPVDF